MIVSLDNEDTRRRNLEAVCADRVRSRLGYPDVVATRMEYARLLRLYAMRLDEDRLSWLLVNAA